MEKIAIWGEKIPFNSKRSKRIDMDVDMKEAAKGGLWGQTIKAASALSGETIPDGTKQLLDTFTYMCEIQRGYEKETYEDVPYIVPMLEKNSDKALIVVPGGGFGYKSSDTDREGEQYEGDLVARKLNEAGISAFVLWYRSNPYRMPIPLLDMQRAIRYVRYHAKDFGISPQKIGIMGFSVGGFACAGVINLLRNGPVVCDGYTPDAVDDEEDKVALAGLIYPVVTFQYNVPLLCNCFDASKIQTSADWEERIREYDFARMVEKNDPPQFICYGTMDQAVDIRGSEAYVSKLEEMEISHEVLKLPGANHGFGACEGPMCEMMPQMKEYAYWIDHFTSWANMIWK